MPLTVQEQQGKDFFKIIMQHLDDHEIPKENFTGFASDEASNITGSRISLLSRLKSKLTAAAVLKYICYSIHTCSSQASTCLSRRCKYLVTNIFVHFSHSAKRKHHFMHPQVFRG